MQKSFKQAIDDPYAFKGERYEAVRGKKTA